MTPQERATILLEQLSGSYIKCEDLNYIAASIAEIVMEETNRCLDACEMVRQEFAGNGGSVAVRCKELIRGEKLGDTYDRLLRKGHEHRRSSQGCGAGHAG